jgi:hypothetical protein
MEKKYIANIKRVLTNVIQHQQPEQEDCKHKAKRH